MFKRILAATDGSEGATKALQAAIELATVNQAELVVLNVFDPAQVSAARDPGPREYARAEHLQGDYAAAKEVLSQNVLTGAKALISARPGVRASFVSLDGDPTTEILRYADQVAADTIVLGTRGRGRIVGLLLGSVSQQVTCQARQFVLIVPADG